MNLKTAEVVFFSVLCFFGFESKISEAVKA